jgi:hypothetical protein
VRPGLRNTPRPGPAGAVLKRWAACKAGDPPGSWPVTRNEYDPERFLESQLTEAEFADIGLAAVARLAATFDGDGGAASKRK